MFPHVASINASGLQYATQSIFEFWLSSVFCQRNGCSIAVSRLLARPVPRDVYPIIGHGHWSIRVPNLYVIISQLTRGRPGTRPIQRTRRREEHTGGTEKPIIATGHGRHIFAACPGCPRRLLENGQSGVVYWDIMRTWENKRLSTRCMHSTRHNLIFCCPIWRQRQKERKDRIGVGVWCEWVQDEYTCSMHQESGLPRLLSDCSSTLEFLIMRLITSRYPLTVSSISSMCAHHRFRVFSDIDFVQRG